MELGHPFEQGFDLTLRPHKFKQWGGATPKSGGNSLDGAEWVPYPDSRVPNEPMQSGTAGG